MTPPLPALPALRSLGDLAVERPAVVVDTREQEPLPIRRLPVVRATLPTGDYSLAGCEEAFAVERKSTADLVACCCGQNRERFERELHRLRGFRFKRLLIVGSRQCIARGDYRSAIRPASVLHSLAAWEVRYDLPVVFCPDADAAARQVERWVWWFAREAVQAVNGLRRAARANVEAERPPRDAPGPDGSARRGRGAFPSCNPDSAFLDTSARE